MDLICKIEYGILIYRIKGGGNMEFLYKLYSNNYFGIGLFIVITILAFAFLVILFFGKRDEKARIAKEKELENRTKTENIESKEEITNDTLEAMTLDENSSLETEEIINEDKITLEDPKEESIFEREPVLEETILDTPREEPTYYEETPREEMDPFVTSNIVLNTDYIMEEQPTMEELEKEDFSKTSDIYNLNSIINENEIPNSEEETIDDVLNKYDAIEETILEEPTFETPEEIITPIVEESEVDVFARPDDSLKKASTPFSSVYLTKEEAETKTEEVVEESKPIMPSRAAFDLPKRVDLPKRSAGAINENIISSLAANNEEHPNQ